MLSTTVVFLLLLLNGHGLCQCFTDTDCRGNVIAVSGERDCCFETDDGLSFLSNGVCTGCASEYFVYVLHFVSWLSF